MDVGQLQAVGLSIPSGSTLTATAVVVSFAGTNYQVRDMWIASYLPSLGFYCNRMVYHACDPQRLGKSCRQANTC